MARHAAPCTSSRSFASSWIHKIQCCTKAPRPSPWRSFPNPTANHTAHQAHTQPTFAALPSASARRYLSRVSAAAGSSLSPACREALREANSAARRSSSSLAWTDQTRHRNSNREGLEKQVKQQMYLLLCLVKRACLLSEGWQHAGHKLALLTFMQLTGFQGLPCSSVLLGTFTTTPIFAVDLCP